KLAVAAAKAVRLAAGSHKNSEDLLFDQQGRGHYRAKATSRKALREWELHLAEVWLINQVATHAAGQAILVDVDSGVLCHGKFSCQGFTPYADTGDGQRIRSRLI